MYITLGLLENSLLALSGPLEKNWQSSKGKFVLLLKLTFEVFFLHHRMCLRMFVAVYSKSPSST